MTRCTRPRRSAAAPRSGAHRLRYWLTRGRRSRDTEGQTTHAHPPPQRTRRQRAHIRPPRRRCTGRRRSDHVHHDRQLGDQLDVGHRRDDTLGELEQRHLRLELEFQLRIRLHQELPGHGQRVRFGVRDASVWSRVPRRRPVRAAGRRRAPRPPPRSPPPPRRNGRCGPDHPHGPPCPHRPLPEAQQIRFTPSPPGRRGRTPPARRAHRRCAPPPGRAPAGGGGRPASRSRPARDTRRRSR